MKNGIGMCAPKAILRAAGLAAALVWSTGACGGDDDGPTKGPSGATETNVAPAPCANDDDCPSGIACKSFDGGAADAGGFCDVDEMEVGTGGQPPVSSSAPAPCSKDTDCPSGIDCRVLAGASVGFCDIAEMVGP